MSLSFCFFNDTATTEIYTYRHTLSLHDALPICASLPKEPRRDRGQFPPAGARQPLHRRRRGHGLYPDAHGLFHLRQGNRRLLRPRSEEHTSELQSLMRISYAVFCLKKKKNTIHTTHIQN